jgi:hypothetical protein
MKKLSKRILAIVLMLGSLSINSCKNETGPKGDPGADGNANVTQISFGSTTITSGSYLTLPGITKSIADKSLILTYGSFGNQWVSLSGYWINTLHNKTYFTRISPIDPTSRVYFDQITGTATSETFDAIRVLVIPANVFVN